MQGVERMCGWIFVNMRVPCCPLCMLPQFWRLTIAHVLVRFSFHSVDDVDPVSQYMYIYIYSTLP